MISGLICERGPAESELANSRSKTLTERTPHRVVSIRVCCTVILGRNRTHAVEEAREIAARAQDAFRRSAAAESRLVATR